MMKCRSLVCSLDGSVHQVGGEADRGSSRWVWLDVESATHTDAFEIGARFGLNPHDVDDVVEPHQLPKELEQPDYHFVVLHGPAIEDERFITREVDAFLGVDYLLTFHDGDAPTISLLMDRPPTMAGELTPASLLAVLFETSAYRTNQLLDAVDDQSQELEDLALLGHPDVVARVQALRRDIIKIRRVLAPQRDVVRALGRQGHRFIPEPTRERIERSYDDYFRLVENTDSSRALLASVIDTYRSTVAERMNEVMKVLTVFSAVFLPLTLMVGLYGMNFENMPELGWQNGYFILIGAMAVLAVGLWLYFARRGFIGGPKVPRVDRAVGKGLAGLFHLTTLPARLMTHRPEQDDHS